MRAMNRHRSIVSVSVAGEPMQQTRDANRAKRPLPGSWLVSLCLLLCACATPQSQLLPVTLNPGQKSPEHSEPYAGIRLGKTEAGGALVLGLRAGPAALAGLREGDRIVRIGDVDVDAASAFAIIEKSSPGEQMTLHVIRDDTALTISMVMGAKAEWSSPAAFRAAITFAATGLAQAEREPEPGMQAALTVSAKATDISARLDHMFAELAGDDTGFHKLPLIRQALIDPGAISRWREDLAGTLRPLSLSRSSVVLPLCETLAIACAPLASPVASDSLPALVRVIEESSERVRAAFAMASTDRALALANMESLLRMTASERTLGSQPDALHGIRAMQTSMRVDLAPMLDIASELISIADRLPDFSTAPGRKPPADLANAVDGDIIAFEKANGGYIVVGGPGANRYAMNRLYAVIDPGGDDVYEWNGTVPPETQLIIDHGGNDRYQAKRGGAGSGWLGVSVLIDRAGDDTYESEIGGCGAGALGFGFLFDDSGADTYRCAAWSVASAIYGAGVLIDLGADADVYDSQVFSQGVGGPRAMGILVDAGGNDLYRANGPVPSAYATPASYMAFSQGVGTGIRPYDVGGVGVLLDYGGDDRYEGGEFAQGGGYLWGVGVLRDEAGNDFYYGNRYAQGFAAHQAFGMLADLGGDDIYWAMSAAAQGAAWDQSIAVLYDAGGDDMYRAQSLGQGAAAQQSRALLHDAGGDDWYWSSGRETQGAGGDNDYHFDQHDPVYSLGVLLDEQGSDRYSTGLGNGSTLLRRDTERDNGGGVAGLAIDRQ